MSEGLGHPPEQPKHRTLTEKDVRGPKRDSQDVRDAVADANFDRKMLFEDSKLSISRRIDSPHRRELIAHMEAAVKKISVLEMKRLGLSDADVSLPESGPLRVSDDLFADGLYNPLNDMRSIKDSGEENVATLFAVLLHESIHRISKSEFVLDDEGPFPRIETRKIGLSSFVYHGSNRGHQFEGLNEGVVEGYARFLLQEYRDLIVTDVPGLTNEDMEQFRDTPHVYDDVVNFIDTIIVTLAHDADVEPRNKWDDVVRAHFAGELMWTRDIERKFGTGSLDILSMVDSQNLDSHVVDYFAESDDEERFRKGLQLRVALAPVTNARPVLRYLKWLTKDIRHRAAIKQALEQLITRCDAEKVQDTSGNFLYKETIEICMNRYKHALAELEELGADPI